MYLAYHTLKVSNPQARKESNLQPSVLETVALPIGATGLNVYDVRVLQVQLLFGLFMRSPFAAKPAILRNLDTFRFFLLVFGAVVVDPATNRTLEMDNFAHDKFFFVD